VRGALVNPRPPEIFLIDVHLRASGIKDRLPRHGVIPGETGEMGPARWGRDGGARWGRLLNIDGLGLGKWALRPVLAMRNGGANATPNPCSPARQPPPVPSAASAVRGEQFARLPASPFPAYIPA